MGRSNTAFSQFPVISPPGITPSNSNIYVPAAAAAASATSRGWGGAQNVHGFGTNEFMPHNYTGLMAQRPGARVMHSVQAIRDLNAGVPVGPEQYPTSRRPGGFPYQPVPATPVPHMNVPPVRKAPSQPQSLFDYWFGPMSNNNNVDAMRNEMMMMNHKMLDAGGVGPYNMWPQQQQQQRRQQKPGRRVSDHTFDTLSTPQKKEVTSRLLLRPRVVVHDI